TTRELPSSQQSARAAHTIISARSLSLLEVAAQPGTTSTWSPELAARALAHLSSSGVEVLNFAQSFSERSLIVTVRTVDAAFARDCLVAAFSGEQNAAMLRDISFTLPIGLVAVISAARNSGLAPQTLATLGRVGAHVLALAQGATSAHLSFVLPEPEIDAVVRALHHDLKLA
ncbi:MAG: aspartate kinase, partial [Chloroflexi bacterium SZAS-1]|nr:aspartate kinase [Chloroflexi bacterium SZAS-1]